VAAKLPAKNSFWRRRAHACQSPAIGNGGGLMRYAAEGQGQTRSLRW